MIPKRNRVHLVADFAPLRHRHDVENGEMDRMRDVPSACTYGNRCNTDGPGSEQCSAKLLCFLIFWDA